MHDIEPYYKWRDLYIASEDRESPFFGRVYDEFTFRNKIYNYFIHPQWDYFGSPTLYGKIIFVDYSEKFACIELIGEWNDCLNNDIMFLKREIVDKLAKHNITKFIILCDNVLNFHPSDDCYYEEWFEDIADERGWISFLNTRPHIEDELKSVQIQHFVNFGGVFNYVDWQRKKPKNLFMELSEIIETQLKGIQY
jgi:hypothetical protein